MKKLEFKVTHQYFPKIEQGEDVYIRPQTIIIIFEVRHYFFNLFSRCVKIARYKKFGKHLRYNDLDYLCDVFNFNTQEQVVEHLIRYNIQQDHIIIF